MKPVILIMSCASYRAQFNDAQRETWIRTWSDVLPDCRFVLGHGCSNPKMDELIFDVDDGYMGVPYKSNAAHRWAREKGYGHVFHCFPDTYINIPRLLASGYEKHDYTGDVWNPWAPIPYVQGGAGSWFSPLASSIIAATPPAMDFDDLWIGRSLRNKGILPVHDGRYLGFADIAGNQQEQVKREHEAHSSKDAITVHLSRGRGHYEPVWMHEFHKAILKAGS